MTPQSPMMTSAAVSPLREPTDSIALTTLMPSTTWPKTVCFPSRNGVATVQMKNCDPFVFGPNPRSLVLEREVFIRKRSSVDASSARAVIGGEIAALTHEGRNHAVKPRSDVSLPLGFLTQLFKIFRRLGYDVGAKFHDDATERRRARASTESHVKVHLGRVLFANARATNAASVERRARDARSRETRRGHHESVERTVVVVVYIVVIIATSANHQSSMTRVSSRAPIEVRPTAARTPPAFSRWSRRPPR